MNEKLYYFPVGLFAKIVAEAIRAAKDTDSKGVASVPMTAPAATPGAGGAAGGSDGGASTAAAAAKGGGGSASAAADKPLAHTAPPPTPSAAHGAGASGTGAGASSASAAKPHVLVLTDEWFSERGGISTINRWMCRGLAESGATVTCALPKINKSDAAKADAKAHGVTLIEVPAPTANPTADDLLQFADQKVVSVTFTAVIGHAHITGRHAIAVAKGRNIPSVIVMHTIPSENDPYMTAGKESEDVAKREVRTKEKEDQLCATAAQAQLVVSVGPKIFKHYNKKPEIVGKNIQLLPFLPSRDNWPLVKFNENCAEVLCFARVDSDTVVPKGVDLLCPAMSLAAQRNGKIALKVRGCKSGQSTKDRRAIEEMCGSHVEVNVYTYGDAKVISNDLESCALMAMPSRNEPFGLTGLEAMMRGVPTLISSTSGLAVCLAQHFPDLSRLFITAMSTNLSAPLQTQHDWAKAIGDAWQSKMHWTIAAQLREALFASDVWATSSKQFFDALQKLKL